MCADAGIAVLHGTARFTGRNNLDVGGDEVEARHVLIASGARPVKLGLPGEEHATTHVASRDAQVVVANLKGGAAVADDSVVPGVAFTVPPITSVGIGEKEARERGIDVDVATQDASAGSPHGTRERRSTHSR